MIPEASRLGLRHAVRVDRSRIAVAPAIRGAVGVVLPLALGAATEHVLAGLVFLGGVLQAVLAILALPARPFGPERDAIAAACRQLAAYAMAHDDPEGPPPTTGAMTEARATLSALHSEHGDESEALPTLVDELERIRLSVLALARASDRATAREGGVAARWRLERALQGAGQALVAIADVVKTGNSAAGAASAIDRVELAYGASASSTRPTAGGPTSSEAAFAALALNFARALRAVLSRRAASTPW